MTQHPAYSVAKLAPESRRVFRCDVRGRFPRHQSKLDFDGGASASRKNTRSFRVVDRLHNFANEAGCDEASQRSNFAYPITGRIGLDEIVTTFAKLRSMTGFEELKDPASGLMSDKLEFTTKFTAGVTPNRPR